MPSKTIDSVGYVVLRLLAVVSHKRTQTHTHFWIGRRQQPFTAGIVFFFFSRAHHSLTLRATYTHFCIIELVTVFRLNRILPAPVSSSNSNAANNSQCCATKKRECVSLFRVIFHIFFLQRILSKQTHTVTLHCSTGSRNSKISRLLNGLCKLSYSAYLADVRHHSKIPRKLETDDTFWPESTIHL